MGPIGCPEIMVINYQSRLLHIPESKDFLLYIATEA
jgi:hypothetical protein